MHKLWELYVLLYLHQNVPASTYRHNYSYPLRNLSRQRNAAPSFHKDRIPRHLWLTVHMSCFNPLQPSKITYKLASCPISTATTNATSRNVSKTTSYTCISTVCWRRSKIPGPSWVKMMRWACESPAGGPVFVCQCEGRARACIPHPCLLLYGLCRSSIAAHCRSNEYEINRMKLGPPTAAPEQFQRLS